MCFVIHYMGFLESYLRLPRYQRVLLGLVGVTVGWYGPSLMQYLFGQPDGVLPKFYKNKTPPNNSWQYQQQQQQQQLVSVQKPSKGLTESNPLSSRNN